MDFPPTHPEASEIRLEAIQKSPEQRRRVPPLTILIHQRTQKKKEARRNGEATPQNRAGEA